MNNDISVLHNLHERYPFEIELKILENTQFDEDLLFKVFDLYKIMICIANKFSVSNIEQIKQGKELIIDEKINNMIQNQNNDDDKILSSFFGSSINNKLLIKCKYND